MNKDPLAGVTAQPFFSHLVELRDRLLKIVLTVLAAFIVLFPFGNDIYTYIAGPMMAVMPEGSTMIATQVASPFLTPFKLSLVSALFVSMPMVLFQFWGFIAPGLYQHEKRLALPLLVSSILLFYLGAAFAYYVVFPLVFSFLTGVTPEGVAVMTDITAYLDFVLTLFFAFGVAFEIPIATILLVWMRITTPDKLVKKRPMIIVGAFVVGMLLTPPDVISQTLLALPMWILFELGVIFSRMFVPKKLSATDEYDDDDPNDPDSSLSPASEPTDDFSSENDVEEFVPLTEAEMDAELDSLDSDENEEDDEELDAVDQKLAQVQRLRNDEEYSEARKILYEVLAEGNDTQIKVAKNILGQLDD